MKTIGIKVVKKDGIDISKQLEILKENGFIETNENVSYIFSFGGDGTILRAKNYSLKHMVPIVAINFGKIGYMADIESKDIKKVIDSIKNNEYKLSKRYLLECNIDDKIIYALNDIVFKNEYIEEIKLYDNNNLITSYRADGLIISTPTGSTAYALSAGGSIIHPELRLLNIVAIASQYLSNRSLILKDTILKVVSDSNIYVDGLKIGNKKNVSLKLSDKYVEILETNDMNYYNVLKNKLEWR
ncbi:NAD(+)/NADH kinase [Oceanivirga miroungae]|uniref:NAD kinase n=1 Tax=Oceanivirga miroungae TaxID=1130046 RepID=A0A6I8M9Z9_9FUSO|nr:NAD(+)/NADH kinase [Oceanivirga miroungae]VWL85147.1 ATP-NAD/AcoX kinase [Oceanivirga miroungae]